MLTEAKSKHIRKSPRCIVHHVELTRLEEDVPVAGGSSKCLVDC